MKVLFAAILLLQCGFAIFWRKNIGAKAAKMLLKLTTGVNFIKVLRAAFTCTDPEGVKKTVKSSIFLALLGYAHVKQLIEHSLVKLTTGPVFSS
jgi:hypothetical protein